MLSWDKRGPRLLRETMKEFARNSGENGREVRNQAKLITYLLTARTANSQNKYFQLRSATCELQKKQTAGRAACELPGAFGGRGERLGDFGPMLDDFQTNFRQMLDDCWTNFGPMLDEFWTGFGQRLD